MYVISIVAEVKVVTDDIGAARLLEFEAGKSLCASDQVSSVLTPAFERRDSTPSRAQTCLHVVTGTLPNPYLLMDPIKA